MYSIGDTVALCIVAGLFGGIIVNLIRDACEAWKRRRKTSLAPDNLELKLDGIFRRIGKPGTLEEATDFAKNIKGFTLIRYYAGQFHVYMRTRKGES